MWGLLTVSAPAGESAPAGSSDPAVAAVGSTIDPTGAWQLHPQVAVRPEPFGALLYHFGTRKLSFLKNRTILAIVESLAEYPDLRSALRAHDIDSPQEPTYLHALGVLAASKMLIQKDSQ